MLDHYIDELQTLESLYSEAKLWKRCFVCGKEKPILIDITKNPDMTGVIALCSKDLEKLLYELIGGNWGMKPYTFASLEKVSGLKPAAFQRHLLPYRKKLLSYVLSRIGCSCRWGTSSVGTKTSKKKDNQTIRIYGDSKLITSVFFNNKTGRVQFGTNGSQDSFENFCREQYLRKLLAQLA